MLHLEAHGGFKLPVKSAVLQLCRRDGKITFKPDSAPIKDEVKLGIITPGSAGVKLQALEMLHIQPQSSLATLIFSASGNASSNQYMLEPINDGRCEIILLRPGDVITSPDAASSVSCVWVTPEVQVHSSAADVHLAEPSETKNGIEKTPEGETEDEDEAILDDTVTEVPVTQPFTQPTKSQLSITPHLPRDRSVVVHETPTTNRILHQHDFSVAASNKARHVEATPPRRGAILVTQMFPATQTGQPPSIELDTDEKRPHGSPEMRVGTRRRKRQDPGHSPSPEVAPATDGPLSKRSKATINVEEGKREGGVMQASPQDNINADPSRMTYSGKAKRRKAANSEVTPTKSSRNSQRSTPAKTVAAYEGPAPRVAMSNSAIKEDSSTVKFLRKQGGALVNNVEDRCNVLCVRDGDLQKTMKVIQAVALGVPIVTDKWLSESARADGLLDLASFKPSVTKQEKEWNFSLDKVWSIPQNPFTGYALYFTPALKKTYKNFREMEKACQTLSAKLVSKRTGKNDKIIVLAAEDGDPEADKMIKDGEPCYHKDLLTTSILRGNLNLDGDEFKIKGKQTGLRKKGQRKSM